MLFIYFLNFHAFKSFEVTMPKRDTIFTDTSMFSIELRFVSGICEASHARKNSFNRYFLSLIATRVLLDVSRGKLALAFLRFLHPPRDYRDFYVT